MPNIGDGKKQIYQCIERLAHASQCTNPYCSIEGCCAMKTCVDHYLKCCIGTKKGCSICVQLMSVCVYHTRTCRNKSCGVPFCREIKQQVKSLQGVSKKRGTPTVKTPIVSSPKSVVEPEINAITNDVTNTFHLASSSAMPPDQMSENDTFAMRNLLMELEDPIPVFEGEFLDNFLESVSNSSMQSVSRECINASRYTSTANEAKKEMAELTRNTTPQLPYTRAQSLGQINPNQWAAEPVYQTFRYSSTANGANYVQSGESVEVTRTSTLQLPYTRTQSLGQINPNQWAAEPVYQTFRHTSTANGANYVQPGKSAEVPKTSTPQLPYSRTQSLGQINPTQWAAEHVHHTLRNTSTANEANFVQPGELGEVSKTTTSQLPHTRTKSLGQIDPNQWAAEQVYQTFRNTSTANEANYVQPGESVEVPRTSTPQLPYTRTQFLGQIDPNQLAAEQVHHTFRCTSTANGVNNAQSGESAEAHKTTTPQLPCTRTQSVSQIDPNQWATEDICHEFKQAQSLPSYHPKYDDKHNDEVFINKYLVEPGFFLQI